MIKPLEDRIIISPIKEKESKTESGLVLASSSKDDPNIATVVAVGPGRVLPSGVQLDPDVKVGDKVVFDQFAVKMFDYKNEEYLSIYSKDIIAIIEDVND